MSRIVLSQYANHKAGKNSLNSPETILAVNNKHTHHILERIDYLRDSIREFKNTILGVCGWLSEGFSTASLGFKK